MLLMVPQTVWWYQTSCKETFAVAAYKCDVMTWHMRGV